MGLPAIFYGASLASPIIARLASSPATQRAIPPLQRAFAKSANTLGQSFSNAVDNISRAATSLRHLLKRNSDPAGDQGLLQGQTCKITLS